MRLRRTRSGMTTEICGRVLSLRPSRAHNLLVRGYAYILASRRNGTLYVGVTSDLPGRWQQHQEELTGGFTSRYGVKILVWYEEFPWIIDAIAREKAIKNWPRRWKIELIEKANPDWKDLSDHLLMW